MSEIIGNILENSPVRTAEAPIKGVTQIEQPKIEKIEPNTASEISESVESPGIVKHSEPVVKKDDKWDGHGYEPVISTENTSGGRAMEIVLQKRNRVPVSYVG